MQLPVNFGCPENTPTTRKKKQVRSIFTRSHYNHVRMRISLGSSVFPIQLNLTPKLVRPNLYVVDTYMKDTALGLMR